MKRNNDEGNWKKDGIRKGNKLVVVTAVVTNQHDQSNGWEKRVEK